MQLFDGLCAGLFLDLVHGPAPPAFFLGRLIGDKLLSLGTSCADDVHAADFGPDVFLHGNGIEDGFVADHVDVLIAGFDPYDRKLAAAGVPGGALYDFIGKSCVLELETFLVNDQQIDLLLIGLDLFLLLFLTLLQPLADEIQSNGGGDQNGEND